MRMDTFEDLSEFGTFENLELMQSAFSYSLPPSSLRGLGVGFLSPG